MFTYSVTSAILLLVLVQGGCALRCWSYGAKQDGSSLKLVSLNYDAPTEADCYPEATVCLSGEIKLSNKAILPVGFCGESLADKSLLMKPGLTFVDPSTNVTVKKILSMEICDFDICNERTVEEIYCYQYGVEFDADGKLNKIVHSNDVFNVSCSGICVHGTVTIADVLSPNEVDSHFFYNSPTASEPIDVGFCSTDGTLQSDTVGGLKDDSDKVVEDVKLKGCDVSGCNVNPGFSMCYVYGVEIDNDGKPLKTIDDDTSIIKKCPGSTKSCISGYVSADSIVFKHVGFCNIDDEYDCAKLKDLTIPVRIKNEKCTNRCETPLCNKRPEVCAQYGADLKESKDALQQKDKEVTGPCSPLTPYCLKGSAKIGTNTHFQICHTNMCDELITAVAANTPVSECTNVFGDDYRP